MQLPAYVRSAIDRRLEGVSRKDLSCRATEISRTYRQGERSGGVITTHADALAYAVARMPATYAAAASALAEAARLGPRKSPLSLLDFGSGPGTASFAALEVWPTIDRVTMLEPLAEFRALAREIGRESGNPALGRSVILPQSATSSGSERADIVVSSYVLIELSPAETIKCVGLLYGLASDTLVLIEPGTPAGFSRIRAARDEFVALGCRILAPCPHSGACPMQGDQWCHFSVRLSRTRDHKVVKAAETPFEDERFSYLVVSKTSSPENHQDLPRIIGSPRISKGGILLPLCTTSGLEQRCVERHRKPQYKAARRLRWGDVLRDNMSDPHIQHRVPR
jgi:ribosomal protein RSM22 (predicted rRNA methylase)